MVGVYVSGVRRASYTLSLCSWDEDNDLPNESALKIQITFYHKYQRKLYLKGKIIF